MQLPPKSSSALVEMESYEDAQIPSPAEPEVYYMNTHRPHRHPPACWSLFAACFLLLLCLFVFTESFTPSSLLLLLKHAQSTFGWTFFVSCCCSGTALLRLEKCAHAAMRQWSRLVLTVVLLLVVVAVVCMPLFISGATSFEEAEGVCYERQYSKLAKLYEGQEWKYV